MHGSSGRPILGANPGDFARSAIGAVRGEGNPMGKPQQPERVSSGTQPTRAAAAVELR